MLAAAAAITAGWTSFDIDGDGHRDAVRLTRHAHFFILRVDTGDRVIRKTVRGFSGLKASEQGEPRIAAVRQINNLGGLEIVVRLWHGASTDLLIVYTLTHDGLVAMTGGPHDPSWGSYVWDLGGSAGTGTSQADCIGRGRIGVGEQWFHRGIWHYRATTYAVRGTRFVKQGVWKLASERMVRRLPADWPRIRRLEFESCPGRTVSQ